MARVMLLVPEGFWDAASSDWAVWWTFFIKAYLNLSCVTVAASPSFRYYRSRAFEEVFWKLGDFGRVTYCCAFFF